MITYLLTYYAVVEVNASDDDEPLRDLTCNYIFLNAFTFFAEIAKVFAAAVHSS